MGLSSSKSSPMTSLASQPLPVWVVCDHLLLHDALALGTTCRRLRAAVETSPTLRRCAQAFDPVLSDAAQRADGGCGGAVAWCALAARLSRQRYATIRGPPLPPAAERSAHLREAGHFRDAVQTGSVSVGSFYELQEHFRKRSGGCRFTGHGADGSAAPAPAQLHRAPPQCVVDTSRVALPRKGEVFVPKERYPDVGDRSLAWRFLPAPLRQDTRPARLVMLGPKSGKTVLLYRWVYGEAIQTVQTLGFNVEAVHLPRYALTVWDVGSNPPGLWRQYGQGVSFPVFCVNGAEPLDPQRDLFWQHLAGTASACALDSAHLHIIVTHQDSTVAAFKETERSCRVAPDGSWFDVPDQNGGDEYGPEPVPARAATPAEVVRHFGLVDASRPMAELDPTLTIPSDEPDDSKWRARCARFPAASSPAGAAPVPRPGLQQVLPPFVRSWTVHGCSPLMNPASCNRILAVVNEQTFKQSNVSGS